MAICQLCSIQKEVKSNPSCKKVCGPKKAIVKRDVKSKVVAKKWQVNFLLLTYHHSHFLAATLDLN